MNAKKTYTKEELALIIEKHGKWLRDEEGGERANLSSANLSYADLSYADLSYASLRYANLSYADLRYADLSSADLSYASLRCADLRYANLSYADLRYADLRYANLSSANLRYADLRYANLRCADLSYANLSYANLRCANGNAAQIKTIYLETYPIAYTAEYLQIGCERHAIADWWVFDDERITRMDGTNARRFWDKWKPVLRQIIEISPATPTGHEGQKQEAA
jgi:hypothetical protein